jgi:hypothetical protein
MNTINLKRVKNHYAIDGIYTDKEFSFHPALPFEARHYWKKWDIDGPADHGAVATKDRRLVGFARCVDFRPASNEVSFAGTWVRHGLRGKGIAQKMWRMILNDLTPGTKISAVSMSDEGRALLKRLVRKYPQFKWQVD